LKLLGVLLGVVTYVSPPHGGVWIETSTAWAICFMRRVTPSRGGVD